MSSRNPSRTERPERASWGAVAARVAVAALLGVGAARAAEVNDALITLEATGVDRKDLVPSALPLRFALLSSGEAYVGGTSGLLTTRLDKDEVAALVKRAEEVRKLPGIAATVVFGPGPAGYRLALRKGKPLDVLIEGEPASAPPAVSPLARLIADLIRFDHPSLRPYEPASYALRIHEGKLVGGCREWTLPLALPEALAGGATLPAGSAAGWPTGATPASVCAGDKSYVVTLRPLVPGERP